MMNYTLRNGLNVPVISVVDESGQILADDQRRVFRHIIQNGFGADVIFANGTTGEWNRLANSERQRLMALAVDEIRQINTELAIQRRLPVEVWVGVNGTTRREVLDNLDAAIQLGADAAVIAPLAVNDLAERDIAHFFLHEMNDLIELSPQPLPVFLYDNADINAPGRSDHLRTRIVKELSRLPWVRGIKVSASRQVLGNYTKAALHFKQPGEFGIYIGNAMLIFDWFRPTHGLVGRLRAGWNEWLLNRALPVGVVSGPGNVLPREWQKAWRVCWAGDEELMNSYAPMFTDFENLCAFARPGHSQSVGKMIACLKSALEYNGVISSSAVAPGTNALTEREKEFFIEGWIRLRAERSQPDTQWTTSIDTARAETKRP